jgi:hypothetical protein
MLNMLGAICGSGDLNDLLCTLATVRPNRDSSYLGPHDDVSIGKTIDTDIMPHIERNIKRQFKISDGSTERYVFVVRGRCEHATTPRIKNNGFLLTWQVTSPKTMYTC